MRTLVWSLAVLPLLAVAGQAQQDTGVLTHYAANLNIGESYVDIVNTGANGASLNGPGLGSAGNLCVNVYAFDPGEELVSCCSCLVTPDQTVSFGVHASLLSNTLTGVRPTSVTVKLLATLAGTGGTGTSCTNSAATATAGVTGLAAWGTTLHAAPGGTYATIETAFTPATLSAGELASITNRCTGIIGNGSTNGQCAQCMAGALDPRVTINTTQQPASATVGGSIFDEAFVSGGFNPTGTVTFNLYNNPTGTGPALSTSTGTLSGGGVAFSLPYLTTAAGTFYWVATYNGDSNNSAVTSGTASEPVIVGKATPTINTTAQPAAAFVGIPIHDRAAVSGGFNPTGSVTFNLYNNPNGTGPALFTDTEPLSGGVAESASFTVPATGTVYWVATYIGDSNNNSVTSGTASEPVIVSKATPLIITIQQPGTATVGNLIVDQAVILGGFNPTGSVTFNLYNNPNGTLTGLLYTSTVPLSGPGAISLPYTTTATGTYYWVATYNGDSNNSTVTSGTADEPVVVTPENQ